MARGYLISLPPAFIAGGYIVLAIASSSADGHSDLGVRFFYWLLAASLPAFVVFWAMDLHVVACGELARKLDQKRECSTTVHWLSLASIVGSALFLAAGSIQSLPNWVEQILLAGTVLLLFSGLWIAARSLVAFEEQSGTVLWHKVVGTFLLIFYIPVGVWFLQERIRRLLRSQTE